MTEPEYMWVHGVYTNVCVVVYTFTLVHLPGGLNYFLHMACPTPLVITSVTKT